MSTASIRCQAVSTQVLQKCKRQSIKNTYPEPETEKERSSVDFPQVLSWTAAMLKVRVHAGLGIGLGVLLRHCCVGCFKRLAMCTEVTCSW